MFKQGLFLAPTVVGESLKGALLLAEVFGAELGLPTNPPPPSWLKPTADENPGSGDAFSLTETRSKTPLDYGKLGSSSSAGLETRLSIPSSNGKRGSSMSTSAGLETRLSTPPVPGNSGSGTSAVATKAFETTPLDANPDRRCYGGGVRGRTDIVQAIELGDRSRLVKFCEAVQRYSPVDAFVRPGEESREHRSKNDRFRGNIRILLCVCLFWWSCFLFCRLFTGSIGLSVAHW